MYSVPTTFSVRDGGRLLVFAEGPRGMQADAEGNPVDLDANLEATVPPKLLKALLADGKIVEA